MQTGRDSGTQNHGSQPLFGDSGRTAGLPFDHCKPEGIPGRKTTGPKPGNREGQPGYLTSVRGKPPAD